MGHALNATEIKTIALKSVDIVGKNLRTCTTRTEGMDSTFKDIYGHDCSWYQKRINKFPELCASDTVRNKCPVACSCRCGSPCPCYIDEGATADKTYAIWDKLMSIKEADGSLGTNGDSICVRSGLEVIAECLKNKATPQSYPIMGYITVIKSWIMQNSTLLGLPARAMVDGAIYHQDLQMMSAITLKCGTVMCFRKR